MKDIDIHILYLPSDNPDWLDQAIASVEAQGIIPRLVPGVFGHIGQSRFNAFNSSTAELVGHIDADDFILPGWIDSLVEACGETHVGVYSGYSLQFEDGTFKEHAPRWTRACIERGLLRRKAILPHLHKLVKLPLGADCALRVALMDEEWGVSQHTGYVWRQHPHQSHRKAVAMPRLAESYS